MIFSGDTSKCSFALTDKPENNDPAVYSINCQSVVLSGGHTEGNTMTAANTATIAVAVTTPGKYSITATTVNGISFSGSGRFTSASTIAKPVLLTATGTALQKEVLLILLLPAATPVLSRYPLLACRLSK